MKGDINDKLTCKIIGCVIKARNTLVHFGTRNFGEKRSSLKLKSWPSKNPDNPDSDNHASPTTPTSSFTFSCTAWLKDEQHIYAKPPFQEVVEKNILSYKKILQGISTTLPENRKFVI